jgi:hypothetical protein
MSSLRVVLLASMLLAVSMLTACGGGSTNTRNDPSCQRQRLTRIHCGRSGRNHPIHCQREGKQQSSRDLEHSGRHSRRIDQPGWPV